MLQNIQHNPRNLGCQLLERVYHVAAGSFWGISVHKLNFKYPWNINGSTEIQLFFPPTHFVFCCVCYFLTRFWNSVTAIKYCYRVVVRRKNRMEEQGSLPLIHRKFHLPLWTGITLSGPFLFACDVINAFASKVSALIVWSGHLSVVVIAIRFVPFSVVPWPSRGKFIHSLATILSMAYHTSPLNRYHSLRLSSFGSVGKFYFFSLPCLWNA